MKDEWRNARAEWWDG